ncbi:hypothetical protein TrVE_jg6853 [Triparma verrucosa]|uniref:NUC153 domain-containing protein n=1 Tax=Triparma verrucosa TaxID=1606542 RepID=A0A9W7BHD3_9STRA|nr:hypothetical protein TrVE_jg6853 [Triparma verrucosa]
MVKSKKKSTSSDPRFSSSSLPSKKPSTKSPPDSSEIIDDRFSSAHRNPKFKRDNKKDGDDHKLVLDERFSSILTDPEFSLGPQTSKTDSRGKKVKKSTADDNEMSDFYKLPAAVPVPPPAGSSSDSDSSDSDSDGSELEFKNPEERIAYLTALSRGEISLSESESSSDSEDDEPDSDIDESLGVFGSENEGVLSERVQAETVENLETCHLAMLNFDWDKVKAVDVFTLVSSFVEGLKSVEIFPSDFGMERMKEEERLGPRGLWKEEEVPEKDEDESSGDDEEENDIDMKDDEAPRKDAHGADSTDFDLEKLRRYEASKLKYYFAIATFNSHHNANLAYKELDGIELEHSSCAIDVRGIPEGDLESCKSGRKREDSCFKVPDRYTAPDFINKALQQTRVQCTWDQGDDDRAAMLTKWGVGGEEWKAMAEGDDLKAYLASSGEESSEDEEERGKDIRKMLLGDDAGEMEEEDSVQDEKVEGEMTFTLSGGVQSLKEKLKKKKEGKDDNVELTPWEKYQEKRKSKRKERKAANKKKGDEDEGEADDLLGADDDDSVPEWAKGGSEGDDSDGGFFMESDGEEEKKKSSSKSKKDKKKNTLPPKNTDPSKRAASKSELRKLLGDDADVEKLKDFDMRGIERIEKMKGKKLKGGRKKKEERRSKDVAGKEFQIDSTDDRFSAVFDGSDDRFGIDKSNPSFKETAAMKEVLATQTQRRKKKKKKRTDDVTVNDEGKVEGGGASALSAMVQKLKKKQKK